MLICPEGVVKIAPRADINKFVTSILCFSAIWNGEIRKSGKTGTLLSASIVIKYASAKFDISHVLFIKQSPIVTRIFFTSITKKGATCSFFCDLD